MNFKVEVSPDDGIYSGGKFVFDIKVPKTYPHDAPKVLCETTAAPRANSGSVTLPSHARCQRAWRWLVPDAAVCPLAPGQLLDRRRSPVFYPRSSTPTSTWRATSA